MKRGARPYTVDFYEEGHPLPQVGQCLREVSHKQTISGYMRIQSVRLVKVRVSRGEVARYKLMIERLNDMPPGGVSFTVYTYPPRKKPKPTLDADRFSPLLPP